jgi:hypothetical protein
MGRNRDVPPETVRLPLSDGDFLTVIKELNAGEYLDMIENQAAGLQLARVLGYLVSWTLVGANDTPIPYSVQMSMDERRSIVRGRDVWTLVEITQAIEAHHATLERNIQEKKRVHDLALAS